MSIAQELREKSDDSLIEMLNVATTHGEQARVILTERMLTRLIDSLNKNANSGNKLAGRVYCLTLLITIATVVYAAATVYQIFK
jgi:hypothetical protein